MALLHITFDVYDWYGDRFLQSFQSVSKQTQTFLKMALEWNVFLGQKQASLDQIDRWYANNEEFFTFCDIDMGIIDVIIIPEGIVVGIRKLKNNAYYFVQRKRNSVYVFTMLNIIGSELCWRFQCPDSMELQVFYNSSTGKISYQVIRQNQIILD